jgi:hypothetical protein
MAAVLATAVMAVDPMMAVIRPMAGDPHHFIVASPIAGAMTVIWPVTKFDSDSLRLNGAPESEAGSGNGCEQQCFLIHMSDSHGSAERTGLAGKKREQQNEEQA